MTEHEREHKLDVFEKGDEIPWAGATATVIRRETTTELPDSIPDHGEPADYSPVEKNGDADYVVLTLDLPEKADEDLMDVMATWLYKHTSVRFNQHGLPAVRAEAQSGLSGDSAKTTVQTPATGDNALTREEAERLASFLREHKGFEPLYALLGGTSSPADMEALAAALDHAATVREYSERVEE